MALSPTNATVDRVIEAVPTVQSSRTYDLFASGLTAIIDGDAAIRQFVQKALMTARSTFTVYNDDYGADTDTLIGQNVNNALFDAEITRMIREAIIFDERISSVGNFVIERSADAVFITFDITTATGAVLTEEVTL